ncbi:MAG: hypothetical protein WCJ30_21310, partial [Deltaproteobacteria bacterium]
MPKRDRYVFVCTNRRPDDSPKGSCAQKGSEALLKALKDAGIERRDVDEVFCGSLFGGTLIGQRILRDIGMTRIPVTNVENACSSGGSALIAAR